MATLVLCWEASILSYHQSNEWIDYVTHTHTACVIPPSSAMAFGMEMSEKLKSISPSAMQRKNQYKTISIEEKLYIHN
jgi:hypothetical protein